MKTIMAFLICCSFSYASTGPAMAVRDIQVIVNQPRATTDKTVPDEMRVTLELSFFPEGTKVLAIMVCNEATKEEWKGKAMVVDPTPEQKEKKWGVYRASGGPQWKIGQEVVVSVEIEEKGKTYQYIVNKTKIKDNEKE